MQQIDISKCSPWVKKNITRLVGAGNIKLVDGDYFFHTKEDVFMQHPKSLEELLEYVVWNTAALFYLYGQKELLDDN